MRIIAGQFRSRPLAAPRGHATRPTSDRAREALFNALESRFSLEGADVLDLFAGTGALGLEALSRGAAAATFVESEARVLRYTRQNARTLGIEEACVFLGTDALRYLRQYQGPPFDLIMADPPYRLPELPELPTLALPALHPGGFFVLEHDRHHAFDDHPALLLSRTYGRTVVSMFEAPPAD
ncbi:MAG: 16S rRNA (guanine(966)-N(2))-methyltransferase RsmD [Bacteroidota bacterium]